MSQFQRSSSKFFYSHLASENLVGPGEGECIVDLIRLIINAGSAKLTGSGGAVVAIFPESKITDWKQAIEKASRVCKQEGYTMVAVEVAIPDSSWALLVIFKPSSVPADLVLIDIFASGSLMNGKCLLCPSVSLCESFGRVSTKNDWRGHVNAISVRAEPRVKSDISICFWAPWKRSCNLLKLLIDQSDFQDCKYCILAILFFQVALLLPPVWQSEVHTIKAGNLVYCTPVSHWDCMYDVQYRATSAYLLAWRSKHLSSY